MLSEDVKDIGITEKRVLLEPEVVRQVVRLLKAKKVFTQKDISEYIEFVIGGVLNRNCSLPYKSFKKFQRLAKGISASLQVKEIKCRKIYNK